MCARDFPLLYQVNLWHLQNDPSKCAKRLALCSNSSLHSQSYFTLYCNTAFVACKKCYFTSGDPHHGISRHIFYNIFCQWSKKPPSHKMAWYAMVLKHTHLAGPAAPTAICHPQLKVRQCPLTCGACGWGPAVPTEIRHSQLRSESKDPHLAGAEQ